MLDNSVLITGEVDRTTNFERGMPSHEMLADGGWVPDPLILDDQALVINVAGHGLVVLTGCGHAGIVNIVRSPAASPASTPSPPSWEGFTSAARHSNPSSNPPSTRSPRSARRRSFPPATADGGPRRLLPSECPTPTFPTASAPGSNSAPKPNLTVANRRTPNVTGSHGITSCASFFVSYRNGARHLRRRDLIPMDAPTRKLERRRQHEASRTLERAGFKIAFA